MRRSLSCFLFLVAGAVFFSGCGGLFVSPDPPQTAEELYRAAEQAMENESYETAVEKYQEIRVEHPFSPYTQEAELGLADAYFKQGEYEAAESAYKEYESRYPGDPEIPRVLYRIGRANLEQFRSIELNTESVEEARQYFTRLIQTRPESEYVDKAREALERSRRYLARHEILVADFYMRTGKYKSAWRRYYGVQTEFQDLEGLKEYAQLRAKEAYFLSLMQSSESTRAAHEGSWRDWFQWL